MIIVKVINQKIVQVAFAGQSSGPILSTVLSTRNNKKQLANFARTLVQSAHQNQKITTANNQQHLIPIARNITFRQCRTSDQNRNNKNAKSQASFSISASSPTTQFISANLEYPSITIRGEEEERESPVEALKRRARDVVEKRETTQTASKYYGQSFNETLATPNERKLVVLMSWLEAKEKHIEKYRQFYLDRGFDVLGVKTSPLDLLLPNSGAKKISEDFVKFMVEKQYSNVVLHGFSVGGYMFGRLLLEIERLDEKKRMNVLNSIRGLVFDSLVPMEGIAVGVSNAITGNKMGAKILEQILRVYLVLAHSFATRYYEEVSDKVWGGPLRCPTLFLMSKIDKISDHKIVDRLATIWDGLGIEVHKVLFEDAPHVQLFQKHQDVYADRVEQFLTHIKMV